MNSLRVKNREVYKIEVNDNGEYIEFDLTDIGLPIKCYEALEKLNQIEKRTTEKEKELRNKIKDNSDFFSETNKELVMLEENAFKEMREAMDTFLGKGACQKIFGDKNYYEMFDDLFEELSKKRKELGNKSYFDKMGFTVNNINQRIMNKYQKNKKNVI